MLHGTETDARTQSVSRRNPVADQCRGERPTRGLKPRQPDRDLLDERELAADDEDGREPPGPNSGGAGVAARDVAGESLKDRDLDHSVGTPPPTGIAQGTSPANAACAETEDLADEFDGEAVGFHKALEEGELHDEESAEQGISPHETPDAAADELHYEALLKTLKPEDNRGPFTRRWMWQISGKRQDADVLAVVIYWTSAGRGHAPNTRRGLRKMWTANNSKELADQTGWSEDEVSKSLYRLKGDGLIGWEPLHFAGKKIRHLWVNWGTVYDRWKEVANGQS